MIRVLSAFFCNRQRKDSYGEAVRLVPFNDREQQTTMRHQGKITTWKDAQGFGFITSIGGGEQVFVHIKAFSNRHRRPIGNEIVTYEVISDDQGRMRAEDVAFIGDNATVPAHDEKILIALPTLFLMFVAVSVLVGQLPFVV